MKPRRDRAGAPAKRKIGPPKPADISHDVQTPDSPPQPVGDKTDLAGPGTQIPPEIEKTEPAQEPLIKAADLFTFSKRRLSAEARALLAKIDEGGIPLAVTENLERIARENGIEVSWEMTPNEIVRRLRRLAS